VGNIIAWAVLNVIRTSQQNFVTGDRHQLRQRPSPSMETLPDNPAPAAVLEEETPPPGWGTDDQISFSKENGKYIQQLDDGSEMEWSPKLKAWMPVVSPSA
jgi:hypothetical protein